MRFLTLGVLAVFIPSFIVANDKPVAAITVEAAAKKVNEKCTVAMKVASVGKGGASVFLNSKEDFRDEGNVTIFINKDGLESFKKAKIDDLAAHFQGKTILVTSTVKLYQKRPQIGVEKAEQVRIVAKKGVPDGKLRND